DLTNGFSFAEILHAYFPNEINMLSFINGRSLNSRMLNWAIIKQFIARQKLPVPLELIDATMHCKESGAEQLLERTYQLLTNKKPFLDSQSVRDSDFSDHPYQQNLNSYERSHASKAIKNNLKISEVLTEPSYAYQEKRIQAILDRHYNDRLDERNKHPQRFSARPTLAERCLRKPLKPNTNVTDWYKNSFDTRSRSAASTNKSGQSRQYSADISTKKIPLNQDDGSIHVNDDTPYKELTVHQHSVPLDDLLQPESNT
ncbi:unnamed protein product, partial [Didymodactylos carnosus]